MFITRKDYIDLLRQLQEAVFPKLKKCWKSNIWPIVQIQVGYYLHLIYIGKINDTETLPNYKPILDEKITFRDFLLFCRSACCLLILYPKWKDKMKNKTLLSGFKAHNTGAYNQYIDPYKEILDKENEENDTIYLDDIFSNYQNKLYLLSRHLHIVILFLLKVKNKIFVQQVNNTKYNTELIKSFFTKRTTLDANHIASLVYNRVIENHFYYLFFKYLLRIVSPQKIWCYNYYNNQHNSLIRAANYLKIVSCEYQHSAISDDHFAYTQWNDIDEYSDFFPHHFYVWDEESKGLILRNFAGNIYWPQIVISGNYYLNRQKEIIQNGSKKYNDHILICLQGVWIPQFIEKAIIESDSKKWYIRLHPRYPQDKLNLLSLYKKYPDKIEIEHSNQLPLYELFKEVSILLVSFSGTAIEAKEFGLKVIIFGEDGYNSYKSFIDKGDFSYANNKDQLLKLIEKA